MNKLAEQLEKHPVITSVSTIEEGVKFEYNGRVIIFEVEIEPLRHNQDHVDKGDVDEWYSFLNGHVIRFDGDEVYSCDQQFPHFRGDVEVITEAIERVLFDETAWFQLDCDAFLNILGGEFIEKFFTSPEVAEILSGWVVTETTEQILDIATGSGTLLEKSAGEIGKENAANLIGIDTDPTISKLAKMRLRDYDNHEIIQADFLKWKSTGEGAETEKGHEQFDAIVGNPPAGKLYVSDKLREEIRRWYSGNARDMGAVFVAKAVTHLSPGGRAAFVLPRNALSDELIEHLIETCSITRIIELPRGSFSGINDAFVGVILTVVKEKRSPKARDTGIGKFNGPTLPNNARGLFYQPLDGIIANKYDTYDAEIVRASHEDLLGRNARRILSSPSILDILRAEEFKTFGDLEPSVEVRSGLQTGKNDFFYFNEHEREESKICDRFFRPLIKKLPQDGTTITRGDIDQYVLDMWPYVDTIETDGQPLDEEQIIQRLKKDGYHDLVNYITTDLPDRARHGLGFMLDGSARFRNPDLVLPRFFDTPRCYAVEVEDAVFDTTVIGIHTETDQLQTAVRRLLNTPLYRELLQIFANPMNFDWYQINIRDLREVLVSQQFLNERVADNLGTFVPPDDDNDIIGANQVLIEACDCEESRNALQRFLAARDDFAWSWLLTLPELKRFQELLKEDEEEAREFVIARFDEEVFEHARETFNRLEFFEHRRDLFNDLLAEFEANHYRSFLAAITLQFEGVLTDLVREVGGDITEVNGEIKFDLPGDNRTRSKNLSELISTFFDGPFSSFLHETIRKRRNKIAHGDVIENDRELAIHFFITFYALCYAALAEYTRFSEGET